MKSLLSKAVLGIACTFFGVAHADTILLKNGDHITGKIVSAAGGKIVITPDFAPGSKITIAQSIIDTFATTNPITLKLKDGTVIKQAVTAAKTGKVKTAQGGTLVAQDIALSSLDAINPPPVEWKGFVGVNGQIAQATSKSTSLGVNASGERRSEKDRIKVAGIYNYGTQETNGVAKTNINNWNIDGSYDYFISKKWYTYAGVQFGGNQINNLTLRFVPSVGFGYQWIDEPTFHFSTETGLAWIYQDFSTEPDPQKDIALRLAYHLDKSFNDNLMTTFHNLSYTQSVQDTSAFLVQTDAGIRIALSKNMYSDFKLNVIYDNAAAASTNKTTSQMLLGLGYRY